VPRSVLKIAPANNSEVRGLSSAASLARPIRSEPLEGSLFYPNLVCSHILETPHLPVGLVRAGGSRERLLTFLQPTAIHCVLYQCNTLRTKRIVGRFREPPASQPLRNTPVVCPNRLRRTVKSGSPPGVPTSHLSPIASHVSLISSSHRFRQVWRLNRVADIALPSRFSSEE
jgi:hypothetical protein